jgi:hypothetical protein
MEHGFSYPGTTPGARRRLAKMRRQLFSGAHPDGECRCGSKHRRYLEVSGINELARDLEAKNICTKARTLRTTGNTRGGIPFGRGCLSHLLRNRFFIGEVNYKGEVLPGEQPAIMDKSLFEAVQHAN